MSALRLELPEDVLEALVERVAERVLARLDINGRTDPEYLTPAEAADLLRCSRQRVYDLLSARRLRRYKDGARVLVSRAEIDAYLAGDRVALQRRRAL